VESGLVLTVRPLEPLIDPWRVPTVPSAAAGGPAHVTVLYPWREAPVSQVDRERLTVVLRGSKPITLTFDRLDRFPTGVLFLSLAQESAGAVRRLTKQLVNEYPDCLPYGGEHPDPHPHLTVACGSDSELDEIEPQVQAALRDVLPFTTVSDHVVLMEQQPTGRWHQAHHVLLGS
jgi:2'-5' RNA ligase